MKTCLGCRAMGYRDTPGRSFVALRGMTLEFHRVAAYRMTHSSDDLGIVVISYIR